MDKFKSVLSNMTTKKDLGYWIFILILINALLITAWAGGHKPNVDYFSFLGSYSSLILAVIAIIYTFFQNATYSKTTDSLDNSAKKIEDVTNKLDVINSITEQLSNLVLETSSIQNTQVGISNQIESIRTEIKTFVPLSQDNSNPMSNSLVLNKDYIQKNILTNNEYVHVILYLAHRLFEIKKDYNIKDFSKYFFEKSNPSIKHYSEHYAFYFVGLLHVYKNISLLDMSNSNDILVIKDYNSTLRECVLENKDKLSKSSKAEESKVLKSLKVVDEFIESI